MLLGKKIRIAIVECDLKQDSFAKKMGVSSVIVNRWILGKAVPALKNIEKMAAILQKPISYFSENNNDDKDINQTNFSGHNIHNINGDNNVVANAESIELLKKDNELIKRNLENLNLKLENLNLKLEPFLKKHKK
jgi:transcriptional regulator with XRE-family HTH domain